MFYCVLEFLKKDQLDELVPFFRVDFTKLLAKASHHLMGLREKIMLKRRNLYDLLATSKGEDYGKFCFYWCK